MISAEERYAKRFAEVDGLRMAYVDEGVGDPIVLLHGNPSSSYQWRNVIPYLTDLGRCIAPDLIGMGDSAKLPHSGPGSYLLAEHRAYLDALLVQLGVRDRITLVLHDWGSVLGFDWAYRHPQAVRGVAYLEAFVATIPSWDDWPPEAVAFFQAIRSEQGEAMVLDDNVFIETVLPKSILRALTEEEMDAYRAPFRARDSRWPTLMWPRELPIEGEPADVVSIVDDYAAWLATADLPKLFISAEPGALLVGRAREFCRTWRNQQEVSVKGIHFVQEDSPDEIGAALRSFVGGLRRPR